MPSNGTCITHLAYADDIVIFTCDNNSSTNLIMDVIRKYEDSSGQKVNGDKSFFLTAPNTCANRINRIRNITIYMDKNFPFNYLGCPIYIGRKKIAYFDRLANKIVKKLNGWQGKNLSYRGRIVLIKNVLQSLPINTLFAMSPPKGTFNLIEKYFANFFWGLSGEKKNFH